MKANESHLTHLNQKGEVHIVNIAAKQVTQRVATAESWVTMSTACLKALREGATPKGDVLATVRLAAIMACKKTSELIPLCHPLPIESVKCEIKLGQADTAQILVTVSTSAKTGVEMEAMTGASVASLTLYDMLKAVDKSMTIGPTRLLKKSGGKSGDYLRDEKEE